MDFFNKLQNIEWTEFLKLAKIKSFYCKNCEFETIRAKKEVNYEIDYNFYSVKVKRGIPELASSRFFCQKCHAYLGLVQSGKLFMCRDKVKLTLKDKNSISFMTVE